jgi:uncharacterized membrane protein
MKYLKYFLVLIVLFALLFVAMGFIRPSISYESEIIVNKPLKESWTVMNDESKISQWLKGLTKVELVSGEKGTVGSVTNYTFVENEQESIIVETIKSIEANQHISMSFVMADVMNMDYRMDFSEKEGKTQIKSSTTNKGVGFIMRSMVSFMKGAMQTQEDENMNNLKKLIESNTTSYELKPVVETVKIEE